MVVLLRLPVIAGDDIPFAELAKVVATVFKMSQTRL